MTNALAEMALTMSRSTELSVIVKATVILTVALVATRLAHRTRASVRHALLTSTFGILLALPIAAVFLPSISCSVPHGPLASATCSPPTPCRG